MDPITQLVFTPRDDERLVHFRVDLQLAWLDIARLMNRGLELCVTRGGQLGLESDHVNDQTWTSHEDRILDSIMRLNPQVPRDILFERISMLLWDRSPASCAHRYGACAHLRGWNPSNDFALGNMTFAEFDNNWERGIMLREYLGRRYRVSKTDCEKRLAMLTSAPLGPQETLIFPLPYRPPPPPAPLIQQAGWLEGRAVARRVEEMAEACEHLFELGLVLADIALVMNRPAWSIREHLSARGFNIQATRGGRRRSDWTLAQDMMLELNRQDGHDWFAISRLFYRGATATSAPLHRQRIDCMLRYQNANHLGGWSRDNDRLLEEIVWEDFEEEWETSLRAAVRPRCTKRTCEVRLLMLQFAVVPYSDLL